MTLLHQAAQKAVEALTRDIMNMRGELEDDWSQAERGCYKLGHRDARHEAVALVNDAIAALESALQQQLEPVAPTFASAVARRKWESLQADGYRMQHIHFARSMDGHERRGTIDPWGKVLWGQEIAPPALQHQEVPREPVADLLRGLVNHWNEFGPEHGLDEMMDAAHRYLAAPPSTTRQQEVRPVFDELVAFEETCEVKPTFADAVSIALAAKKRTRQQEVGSGLSDGAERRIDAVVEKLRGCKLGCGPFGQCKAAMHGVPSECAAAPSTPEKAGGVSPTFPRNVPMDPQAMRERAAGVPGTEGGA